MLDFEELLELLDLFAVLLELLEDDAEDVFDLVAVLLAELDDVPLAPAEDPQAVANVMATTAVALAFNTFFSCTCDPPFFVLTLSHNTYRPFGSERSHSPFVCVPNQVRHKKIM